MKRLLLLALLGVVLSTLNGCAMSDEDKDFYGRGWIRPTDLDHQYPHHAGTPTSTHGGQRAGGGSSADQLSTTRPAHDSAWDVPGEAAVDVVRSVGGHAALPRSGAVGLARGSRQCGSLAPRSRSAPQERVVPYTCG